MKLVDRICLIVGMVVVGVALVRLMAYAQGPNRLAETGNVLLESGPAGKETSPPGPPPGRGPFGATPDREGSGRAMPGMPRMPLVVALDANGDGLLSAEEIAQAAEALKKLDKNGDGQLSREELFGVFRAAGPGPGGPPRMGPIPSGSQSSLEMPPQPKDEQEKKILSLILEEIPREQGRRMNVPPVDGRMLRMLAETLDAHSVVEIGTSNGISAMWMGLALRKTGGKLLTHEIDPQTAAIARKNFERAGMSEIITVVEGDAHKTISQLKGPIDLVFIDADKEGYMDYLQKLLPLVRPGGVICAHNVNARWAETPFFKAITTDGNLETLFYTPGGGMSITLKKR